MKTFLTISASVTLSTVVSVVMLTAHYNAKKMDSYSMAICITNGGIPVDNVCLENSTINLDWYEQMNQ